MKAAMLAFGIALFAQTAAFAFPPTATTSPGYDRALAESRKARQMEQPPMFAPARPKAKKHRR